MEENTPIKDVDFPYTDVTFNNCARLAVPYLVCQVATFDQEMIIYVSQAMQALNHLNRENERTLMIMTTHLLKQFNSSFKPSYLALDTPNLLPSLQKGYYLLAKCYLVLVTRSLRVNKEDNKVLTNFFNFILHQLREEPLQVHAAFEWYSLKDYDKVKREYYDLQQAQDQKQLLLKSCFAATVNPLND